MFLGTKMFLALLRAYARERQLYCYINVQAETVCGLVQFWRHCKTHLCMLLPYCTRNHANFKSNFIFVAFEHQMKCSKLQIHEEQIALYSKTKQFR